MPGKTPTMTSNSGSGASAHRRRAITDSLRRYLLDATSKPAPPPAPKTDATGWFAPAPHSHSEKYGREPWSNMRDVEVGVAGRAVAVSFTWRPDDDPTRSYVVVLHAPDWDEVTGSDSLITALDLLLDYPDWQSRAQPIGSNVLVVIPNA